jgi:hypothetical protein
MQDSSLRQTRPKCATAHLDPDVVYKISQLWAAFDQHNGDQFAYFRWCARREPESQKRGTVLGRGGVGRRGRARPGPPVSAVTEACSALYLQTQRYWRAKQSGDDDLESYGEDLERQYYAT